MVKKLVGYVRVSSESQEDNTSLQNQIERIEAYCMAFGYELVKIFKEVATGTKADIETRPIFNEAIEYLKNDNADGIIALKLDRIARNTRDVLTLVEDVLEPQNKMLVLLDLQVDTSTPTGKMILTVMSAVAQLERDTINERTQGGRKTKAQKGGYAYGKPKFGYQTEDKELKEDSSQQETIRLIKRHRRSGKSYQKIADYLNAQNIPTKQGKKWSSSVVYRICQEKAG
ncbi:recombinase family protein (plasmid) [Cyanobacterium aponinum AL20118]|uniref:Recombinase family protein n=1 Tax=Cyanobacterium aponinum AL20115 TaxID=3090662 RepID=A0AAF0ZHQ9_9CHRO|nr:recombinase family protein [Cyanobacterium aponinum]WPF90500.1 recombinase family protein [Cyanobacterium aponinum AL20115]